jgi:NAD(P)-dependent dehydrogenase (short-subunit alcohol dehydrogenase family)
LHEYLGNGMKTLVITGGSKGIGLDISLKFLEMGWQVFSGSRSYREIESRFSNNFFHIDTDVRVRKSVHDFLNKAKIQTGKVDCFINNAGYSQWKPISEITEVFLSDILSTNLMGYFWGCQSAAEIMGYGDSIINISSLAAKRGTPDNSAYVASKFGVAGLTQSISKELGPKGIRVNAVCPVLVETEGLINALAELNSPANGNPRTFLQNFASKQTSLGFLPSGVDVANLCYFLASAEARAITGQSINVDCGVLPN